MGSVRLNTILSSHVFNNTTLAITRYEAKITNRTEDFFQSKKTWSNSGNQSNITDVSLSTDFDYFPIPQHHIRFGGQLFRHQTKPEEHSSTVCYSNTGTLIDTTNFHVINQIDSHELNLYVDDDFPIGQNIQANVGLHGSWYRVNHNSYFSLQPRISFCLSPNSSWKYKAAFSMMQQNIHMLSSAEINIPTDLWVPVTSKIRPMQSLQYSLGCYYSEMTDWTFSLETYYKHMKNLLEYKDGMISEGKSVSWENCVESGKGDCYGLELEASRKIGRMTSSASYCLSRSTRVFQNKTVNMGRRFPFSYDRNHVVKVLAQFHCSKQVELNAEWEFLSGARMTTPIGYMIAHSPDIDSPHYKEENRLNLDDSDVALRYDKRNNYKLPCSHQLNLGASFHKKIKHCERIINLSIINAYGHKNPDIVRIVSKEDSKNVSKDNFQLRQSTFIIFLPSFSYTFIF